MAHDRPWWRQLGSALAALVLTVLVFGPSLDGLVCTDDFAPVATATASELPMASSPADRQTPPVDLDGCGPSIHCHCHHGPSHVAVLPETDALPALDGELRVPTRERLPVLDRQFELIRPPRA